MAESSSAFPLFERRALLGIAERQRLPGSYSDLTAPRLTSVLMALARGECADWADLCQYALKDDLLIHLYTSRITRVAQADYQVVPNDFGKESDAKLAAEFMNELLGRVTNWDQFVRNALHAIALGYSPNEIEWDTDGLSGTIYARAIHYINPNRFRYDDQWKLRLYDHGTRTTDSRANGVRSLGARSMYGEVLLPQNWIVHTHNEVAGDPCDAGLMRMSIWRWLFRRWADTFWIQNLEKYGAPFISAEVQPNTPESVRQQIKAAIVDLGIDRAAVMEAGGKLTVTPPAMGTGTASQHELYMDFASRSLTSTWLGASDVTAPGENGSQAAVGGRISAVTDPRMITDGTNFCGTLHRTLFYWALQYNRHRFGNRMPPVPKMQLKTASDEAQVDSQDLATQNAADVAEGNGAQTAPGASPAPYEVRGDDGSPGLEDALPAPAPGAPSDAPAAPSAPGATGSAPVEVKKQETALNGAQVSSLLEVLNAVATDQLPRQSAKVLIQVAYNLDAATAEQLLGTISAGFTPTPEAAPASPYAPKAAAPAPDAPASDSPPAEASIPKVQSRSHQGRQTIPQTMTTSAKTSLITSSSMGPLAAVLQRKWEDPAR